jgi:hypothetical protein
MAGDARSGLKLPDLTTVALLFETGERSQPRKLSRRLQSSEQLLEKDVESLSRLLQHGKGQVLIRGQTQVVAVIADVSMGTPGASGGSPLMMSSEVALFAHKAKRGQKKRNGLLASNVASRAHHRTGYSCELLARW